MWLRLVKKVSVLALLFSIAYQSQLVEAKSPDKLDALKATAIQEIGILGDCARDMPSPYPVDYVYTLAKGKSCGLRVWITERRAKVSVALQDRIGSKWKSMAIGKTKNNGSVDLYFVTMDSAGSSMAIVSFRLLIVQNGWKSPAFKIGFAA
jgi:hypothetical protein